MAGHLCSAPLSGERANARRQGHRELDRPPQAPLTAFRRRQRGDGSCWSGRHGNGQCRGQAARCADSCNSTQPPVWRVMFVACWWARAIVESTATAQSMIPASSATVSNRANTMSQMPLDAHPLMPGPDRLPRPKHLGNVAPGDPTPVPIDDPLHHGPDVTKRPALLTRPRRQEILDQRPLTIRKQLKSRHVLSLGHNTRNNCQTRPSASCVQDQSGDRNFSSTF